MNGWYLAYGGGLGDVVWDFLRDKNAGYIGALKREHNADIRVYTLCHNDGVMDLFQESPYISEHINEPWRPPSAEDIQRFSQPIDGYQPLQRTEYRHAAFGPSLAYEQPRLFLSKVETDRLNELCSVRPLIVLQPFAGLSDRDALDFNSLRALVYEIVHLEPNARIVVVGKNHERTHKYSKEEVTFEHPNLVNLIDKEGIRFGYYLVANCDAFGGAHSNLIRTAWDFRKRNVCIMPHPGMTRAMGTLDAKYRYGFVYEESRQESYQFDQDNGGPRQFHTLNIGNVARHLLGR